MSSYTLGADPVLNTQPINDGSGSFLDNLVNLYIDRYSTDTTIWTGSYNKDAAIWYDNAKKSLISTYGYYPNCYDKHEQAESTWGYYQKLTILGVVTGKKLVSKLYRIRYVDKLSYFNSLDTSTSVVDFLTRLRLYKSARLDFKDPNDAKLLEKSLNYFAELVIAECTDVAAKLANASAYEDPSSLYAIYSNFWNRTINAPDQAMRQEIRINFITAPGPTFLIDPTIDGVFPYSVEKAPLLNQISTFSLIDTHVPYDLLTTIDYGTKSDGVYQFIKMVMNNALEFMRQNAIKVGARAVEVSTPNLVVADFYRLYDPTGNPFLVWNSDKNLYVNIANPIAKSNTEAIVYSMQTMKTKQFVLEYPDLASPLVAQGMNIASPASYQAEKSSLRPSVIRTPDANGGYSPPKTGGGLLLPIIIGVGIAAVAFTKLKEGDVS